MSKELKIKAFQQLLLKRLYPVSGSFVDVGSEPDIVFPVGRRRVWHMRHNHPNSSTMCRICCEYTASWQDFDLTTCSDEQLDVLLVGLDPHFNFEVWQLQQELR